MDVLPSAAGLASPGSPTLSPLRRAPQVAPYASDVVRALTQRVDDLEGIVRQLQRRLALLEGESARPLEGAGTPSGEERTTQSQGLSPVRRPSATHSDAAHSAEYPAASATTQGPSTVRTLDTSSMGSASTPRDGSVGWRKLRRRRPPRGAAEPSDGESAAPGAPGGAEDPGAGREPEAAAPCATPVVATSPGDGTDQAGAGPSSLDWV